MMINSSTNDIHLCWEEVHWLELNVEFTPLIEIFIHHVAIIINVHEDEVNVTTFWIFNTAKHAILKIRAIKMRSFNNLEKVA
jgi:hypothetical protein